MSVFASTLEQMLVLFIVLLIGLLARRLKLMDDRFDTMLSTLVMNVTLPAMILASVLGSEELPAASVIGELLVCSLLAYTLVIAVAELLPRLVYRTAPAGERGAHSFAIAFGNVSFMGFPVVDAVFGPEAVFYASVFNIPFNLFVFTYGVATLKRAERPGLFDSVAEQPRSAGDTVKSLAKSVVNPCFVASFIAIFLALFGITDAQGAVGTACDTLGQFTTPASLLVIGSRLGKMSLSSVLGHVRPYVTSLLRLLAVPLLVFFLFGLFVDDALVLGVMTLCSGMPVASMGTMLSLVHGGDVDTIATITFVSTVLSLLTIPLLAMLVI